MANEAILRNKGWGEPINFKVSDALGIEKGTILKMTDPRTAIANDGAADIIAGIARREKIANDGRDQLAVFTPGCGAVFDMTCATGGCTLGTWVCTSGANLIRNAVEAEIAAGKAIGKALETGTSGEVVQVLI